MNRRNLLLGTAGLAVGITGCSKSSNGSSQVSAKKITLNDCPALKAYIGSLCDIPAGTFKMGSSDGEPDEAPVHEVPISAFRMGKTPVTVDMWEEFAQASRKAMPPEPNPTEPIPIFDGAQKFNVGWKDKDHPIVGVDWDGCQQFARWASEVSGVNLSLPSEAQHEYACRGGRDSLKYPWGNEFDRSKVWSSDEKLGDRGSTGSVNRRVYIWLNHQWGLIDLIGNVSEWCLDWYDPKWYQIPQASDRDVVNVDSSPTVKIEYIDNSSENKPCRCVRGGSWGDANPNKFRCATRELSGSDGGYIYIGFRLVAGPK